MTFGFSGFYSAGGGVGFQTVINGTPAHLSNLNGIIVGLNGEKISNFGDVENIMSKVSPGEEITIQTKNIKAAPQAVFSGYVVDKLSENPVNFLSINNYFDPTPIITTGENVEEFKLTTILNPENNETAFIGIGNVFEAKQFSPNLIAYSAIL